MAQADSSIARIGRFGTLTTVSALGQIVGPVVGGVIIGHTEQPSLPATSSALLVAAWVFVAGLPAAAVAMRTRIQLSTVREGKAERVWGLLRRRGMPAALMTSFSAKSGVDLLLVYVPLLGVVVGLTSSQVGILLGISSSGALLARAATPFFVRRIPNLRLTVIATGRRGVVSARPRGEQQHRADDGRDVGARLRARPVADHHHGLGRQPGRRHQPGLGARPAGRDQPRRAGVHPRGSGRGIRGVGESRRPLCCWRSSCSRPRPPGSPVRVAVLSPRVRERRLATSAFGRSSRSSAHRCAKFVAR